MPILSVVCSVLLVVLVVVIVVVKTQQTTVSSPGGSSISSISGLVAARAKGKYPNLVTWAGKQAVQVTYQAGKIHHEGCDTHITFLPPGILPSKSQCRVKFSLYFADNFPWDATSSHSVGGKLGGFSIGTGDASGGNFSPTGSTYRLTFHDGGAALGYLYPEVKQTISSHNIGWALADQSQQLQQVSNINDGLHIWSKDPPHFKKGQWNAIEMFMKLNTPGKYDGVMELVVNGMKMSLNTVRYRNDNAIINDWSLDTFFGGGSLAYAPPQTTKTWYADFVFSTA
jgi:hypothetical protein